MFVMLSVRPRWMLSAAAMLFVASLTMSASAPQAKPLPPALTKPVGELTVEEETEFSDAAEKTMERVCIACHPFENIVKTRRLPKDWADQVTVMSQRGAPGTDPDFALIKKYLVRYYGIVRVNTASAEGMATLISFTSAASLSSSSSRSKSSIVTVCALSPSTRTRSSNSTSRKKALTARVELNR